jgi:hypothetical protein
MIFIPFLTDFELQPHLNVWHIEMWLCWLILLLEMRVGVSRSERQERSVGTSPAQD